MKIQEILDRAISRANLTSDYALAKAMGVNTGTVSNWRKGKQHPSNEEAVQLATLAGLDEMQVIAWIEIETAKTEKKKEFWKHYIESRGIVATLAMTTLAASIIFTSNSSEADVLQFTNYDASSPSAHLRPSELPNIHYALKAAEILLIIKALALFTMRQIFPQNPAPNYKPI